MLPSVPPLCGEVVSAAAAQAKPAAAGGAASRALALAPPEERQQQVQQQLQGMVRELLGRDVDPEEPLMEAGLDSMSAVELHSGVQQTMGVELPATLMFDYPTISAAAVMISDEVGASVASEFDSPFVGEASQRSHATEIEIYPGDAKVVIFCLAYAGGVASSIFSSWTGGLPSYIAIAPLDLPGRGHRNNEDRSCDICGIASQFSKLISECEVPYYIFAHSTGAILMHEILMDMKKNGYDGNLIGAFASACPAPSYFMRFSMALFKKSLKKDNQGASSEQSSVGVTPSQADLLGMLQLSRQLSSVQSDSMLDMLEGSGVFSGIEKMRSNESIYSQVMPLIIDDIEMIVRYKYEPHELLETPIVCFRGSDDSTHEPDTVRMWKNVTVDETSVFVVPGDHFFLHTKVAKDIVLSVIMEKVGKFGVNVPTQLGDRVPRETESPPSSSNNVAIIITSGMDSNNLCSMQEILNGFVERTFCAPSDSGISKLRHLRAVPNVIVASAAGLEMAITLSNEYASVFGEVPKIAVFECEVVTEVTVPEPDTRLGTQDMIHFVSYTSKGPKKIRTMGNHLSVAIPCQPNEIIDFKGNCVRIVVRALAGFICSRSPRQPE
jgi:surfactin synthase thioesterase subunit/acyl carrier protein